MMEEQGYCKERPKKQVALFVFGMEFVSVRTPLPSTTPLRFGMLRNPLRGRSYELIKQMLP